MTALLLHLMLAPLSPGVIADDDPLFPVQIETVRKREGSVEYRHFDEELIEYGVTSENQIVINFEAITSQDSIIFPGKSSVFLPVALTIDLQANQQNKLLQADVTVLRTWILSLLSYRMDYFAFEDHDISLFRVSFPIRILPDPRKSNPCDFMVGEQCVLRTTAVISIGAEAGYRWMRGENEGGYVSPTVAGVLGAEVFNRFFLNVTGFGKFSLITGPQKNYVNAGVELRAGMRLEEELTIAFTSRWGFLGARSLEGYSAYYDSMGIVLSYTF